MARIKNSILIGMSGRIGNVVSCCRHGKYYLRTLPVEVHQPDSEKQLTHRMRFALIQQFLKPIRKFIHLGFGAYAEGRSALKAAMSYNLKHALSGSYPNLVIDYAKARVSHGNLPAASEAGMLQCGPDSLLVTWKNTEGVIGAKDTDSALILIYSAEAGYIDWYLGDGRRSGRQSLLRKIYRAI